VFPALGVVAVKAVPPQNQGAALATYTVFMDMSLGVTGPLAGLPLTSGNILPIFYVRQRITAVFYNKSSSVVLIVVFVPGKASCN
ncbi:hypothetical protein MJN54_34785, partial [Salmonella enterica subsp. enterica serovar Kentucky]|nr:hypothetical protein [Salmonella enterica subsp. enterica serovar Kentucky]